MKTRVFYFALAVAAAAIASSCVKEQMEQPQGENGIRITGQVFEAAHETPTVKSVLDGLTPKWVDGDAIWVSGSDEDAVCTFAGENKFQTSEDVKIQAPFYAVYPAADGNTVDRATGVFTASVPSEQIVPEGHNVAAGALVAVAAADEPVLAFKNAVGIVKIDIKRNDILSVKIESTVAGEVIAGKFTMNLNPDAEAEGEEPEINLVADAGATSVTLKPAGEEGAVFTSGVYYATVLPCNLSGIKVTFTRTAGETTETASVTKTAATAIARNGGVDLGGFFTYEISTAQELLEWNKASAKWTAWDVVTLTDNINCADVITSDNWKINTFTGVFDGNNKTIDNFVIEKAGPAAFFEKVNGGATVNNLTFGEGCSFTATLASTSSKRVYAASLATVISGTASITNIVNKGAVTAGLDATNGTSGSYIGGICASHSSTGAVVGCKNYGTISFLATPNQWMNCGGLFGEITGTCSIRSCTNYGKVQFSGANTNNKSINLGGITAGVNAASFSGCVNLGAIESNATAKHSGGTNIGGIVGVDNAAVIGTITDCVNGSSTDAALGALTNNCAVGGELRMGGFIGYIQAQECNVTNFKNYGKITNNGASTTNVALGGVVGIIYNAQSNKVSDCENHGVISNKANLTPGATSSLVLGMGGVVGWLKDANTSISGVNNSGSIENTGDLVKSSTTGVNGRAGLGGIVGIAQKGTTNSITSATNSGDVSHGDSDIDLYLDLGGIVGHIDGNTTVGGTVADDVVNNGKVFNKKKAQDLGLGGIVGSISGAVTSSVIQNCKNTNEVSHAGWLQSSINTNGIGGILGYAQIVDAESPAAKFTIQNCTNAGVVQRTGAAPITKTHVGGIVGAIGIENDPSTAEINSCVNKGNVSHGGGAYRSDKNYYCYTGGIIGYFRCAGSLISCENGGIVTNMVEGAGYDCIRVGGIAGGCDCGVVSKCTNMGAVKDESHACGGAVGGIVGYVKGNKPTTITECDNSGAVSGQFNTVVNTADYKGTASNICLGGVVGATSQPITFDGCSNSGNVTNSCLNTNVIYAGGLMGFTSNLKHIIKESTNSGTITNDSPLTTGKIALGGLVGICYANEISKSHNTGDVINNCSVKNANNDNVGGNEYVGGLVGQIEANVSTSISDCSVETEITVQNTTRNTNHFSGLFVGRLTDKVDGTSGADATLTTTISGSSVKGGSYNGTPISADNCATYTFGHGSNYGGQGYTKGKTYAMTGITYVE